MAPLIQLPAHSLPVVDVISICSPGNSLGNNLYVTGFWKITHMGANDTVNI